jgi:hypothetical protein
MRKNVSQNETPQDLLKNYKSRLAKEGWLKAALCGMSAGFSADILCATAFWVFGIKLFWICILVFAAVTAIATPLFYFCRFKNSRRQVASRVDMLGLEERILTMTQLENDDSYIARRQREDAINALKSVNSSFIKIAVSASMVVACCVMLVLGIGATTASALSSKSLITMIQENKTEPTSGIFHLIYGVKSNVGGRVDGELEQTVNEGESGKIIQAVADDGYVFVGWTDGHEDATRTDTEVSRDIVVNAIFIEIESDEEEDIAEEEKREGNPGNKGNNGAPKSPESPKDGSADGNGSGDGAGAGADAASNQVIDGSTYYGDEYGGSLSNAQDSMNSDSNLSGDEKGVIGDYFHNIQK